MQVGPFSPCGVTFTVTPMRVAFSGMSRPEVSVITVALTGPQVAFLSSTVPEDPGSTAQSGMPESG